MRNRLSNLSFCCITFFNTWKWQAVMAMDDRYFHNAFVYVSFNMSVFVALCHFCLKFCPIPTKDFLCLNYDNLRKWNPSFEGFSVTVHSTCLKFHEVKVQKSRSIRQHIQIGICYPDHTEYTWNYYYH